jgi:phage shock protein PspC (stress-responsive transcriptional regulator)
LVLKSSRFGLDPRAAAVTWTILVFLAALVLFFAYLLFPLVRLV